MRLFPAHTREAKAMAKGLKAALGEVGLTRDCRDPTATPPTLQQTQELMAQAMGYPGGWHELGAEVSRPHTPVYVDRSGDDGQRMLMEMAERLAALLGFDYTHGTVWNALEKAGVGFSPKARRQLEEDSTPWGIATDREVIAPGIEAVETGGHGGIVLSAARQAAMPSHLRLEQPFYEEDEDWALVALAFPEIYRESLMDALARAGVFTSPSVPRERDANSAMEAFYAKHSPGYIAPENDPMNRAPTPDETRVVAYLAECVRLNRKPVALPDNRYPSLQEWVAVLAKAPTVDGAWPLRSGPWREHWGSWERSEADLREREAHDMALLSQYVRRNDDDDA